MLCWGGGVVLGWGCCVGVGVFVLLSLVCGRVLRSPSRPGRAGLLRNRAGVVAEIGAARPAGLSGVTAVKAKRPVLCQDLHTCPEIHLLSV